MSVRFKKIRIFLEVETCSLYVLKIFDIKALTHSQVSFNQRFYQRWLDKIIYKTEMKFWAVLGSRGHKYATFRCFFYVFKDNFFLAINHLKKLLIMAVGRVFFVCSPDCPKQPRTSYPFYKLFYSTFSGRISG